jgi:hypothetical protein
MFTNALCAFACIARIDAGCNDVQGKLSREISSYNGGGRFSDQSEIWSTTPHSDTFVTEERTSVRQRRPGERRMIDSINLIDWRVFADLGPRALAICRRAGRGAHAFAVAAAAAAN